MYVQGQYSGTCTVDDIFSDTFVLKILPGLVEMFDILYVNVVRETTVELFIGGILTYIV